MTSLVGALLRSKTLRGAMESDSPSMLWLVVVVVAGMDCRLLEDFLVRLGFSVSLFSLCLVSLAGGASFLGGAAG